MNPFTVFTWTTLWGTVKTVCLYFAFLVCVPTAAIARPVPYEIKFSGNGLLPTQSRFFYDADTTSFFDFVVHWNNELYDFTFRANNGPDTQPDSVYVASCGVGTGPAYTFAFITHAPCTEISGADAFWSGSSVTGFFGFFNLPARDFAGDQLILQVNNKVQDLGGEGRWRVQRIAAPPP